MPDHVRQCVTSLVSIIPVVEEDEFSEFSRESDGGPSSPDPADFRSPLDGVPWRPHVG
jgi:hypothetical protein